MVDIIAVANPKGGSAKTSTAVNLCCALAATRRRILLMDLDPHCCATVALGFPRSDGEDSLAGVLISNNKLKPLIRHYDLGNFDIIPGHEDLTAVHVALYNEPDCDLRLRQSIEQLRESYDMIIIDCPPSLGCLTVNALCASDYLIIPVPCEYFALDSMNSLIARYNELISDSKTSLKLLGVVRTLYDEAQPLNREISNDLKQQFGDLLFDCVVAYNQKISECVSSGRPVMLYDKSSTGARAYLALAGEILTKLRSCEGQS